MLKKKLFAVFTSVTLIASSFVFNLSACYAENGAETGLASESSEGQIKNIIFMIPDGGGDTLMDLANMVKTAGGFDRTKYPNATLTDTSPMTLLSYLAGFETTRSANFDITDSAAGGTALSSGYKTNNGFVGITPNKTPRANILEAAKSVGKAVGIVSTAEWPHATPASYTAHAESREDYYNIYKQIENKELDVVLGAGYGTVTKYEGATIQNAIDAGYKIIVTPEDAAGVVPGDKLWGNVTTNSLPYDINNSVDKASLPELAQAAISALSGDEDGFFLMIEGSSVDGGGHSNNAVTTTSEYLAFDEAWRIAVEFAKGRTDTIVLGAPDHDTGGLNLLDDMTAEIEQIRVGTNPSTFTWEGGTSHTARNCPVWVYLPEGVEMIEGLSEAVGDSEAARNNYLIDNTAFAPYMASLMGADLDEVSKELFVDVTSIGAYMPTSNRFVFNNGDKYIYTNTDTYYKNGEPVDMHGKVAVYLTGRFYVPAEMIDEEDWNYVNSENPDIIDGSGTAASPYIIDSIADYKEFLIGVANDSTSYDGAYFRQECDLVLDNVDFGLNDKVTFTGNYDGNGHTITWNVEASTGFAVFPAISGTVSNLGVIGSITSTSAAPSAGIAYHVLSTGKITNCYSNLDYEGMSFYGIAVKNDGIIHNTYYGGNAEVSSTGSAISDGGTYINSYYVKSCGLSQTALGVTEISDSEAKSSFVHTLNGGIARVEAEYGISPSHWVSYGDYPEFESTEPYVTKVRLYPENVSVGKGDMFQFDVNVDGKYDYSWSINWSMEPQSELSGTYIDKNGIVHIDENETITSFTVIAKSKANGSVADSSIVTVGTKDTRPYPVGSGTKADPYLIRNEDDFYSFTTAIIDNEQYKDKYFRQTCDIDMAGYPGYAGMGGSNVKFYGTYDGAGHIINVNITGYDGCLFPYTLGTIMNLGSTGSITNTHQAAGIARSLRSADGSYGPGKIVNCWSSAAISGTNYSGGIAPSNSGFVANCYFAGTLKTDATHVYAISAGKNYNCYYTDSGYSKYAGNNDTLLTEQAVSAVHLTLNAYRAEAAEMAGLDTDDLVSWIKHDGAYPTQTILYPYSDVADSIKILPNEIKIGKGSSRQLAISGGEVNNSDVTWTIETSGTALGTVIDEYGYITIASDEANKAITVKAALKSDEAITATATITVVKSTVPDGSKDNPYIIANEADFLRFTNAVLNGEQYKDKYFLQTASLDMAGYPGYKGMGSAGKFYGTYNGGGHIINVDLEGTDECIFPYTLGLVMNLGTTGTIKNTHNSAGVVRSLRAADGSYGPGKVVNCWSSVDITVPQDKSVAGIALHNGSGHVVANCYYFGSLPSHGTIISGASKTNCYFVNDSFSGSSNSVKITEQQMKTELHTLLNGGLKASADAAGVNVSELISWRSVNNGNPICAILGDVDGTSRITLMDLTAALVLFAQGKEDFDDYKSVLDLDNDQNVTLYDVHLLLRMLVE